MTELRGYAARRAPLLSEGIAHLRVAEVVISGWNTDAGDGQWTHQHLTVSRGFDREVVAVLQLCIEACRPHARFQMASSIGEILNASFPRELSDRSHAATRPWAEAQGRGRSGEVVPPDEADFGIEVVPDFHIVGARAVPIPSVFEPSEIAVGVSGSAGRGCARVIPAEAGVLKERER